MRKLLLMFALVDGEWEFADGLSVAHDHNMGGMTSSGKYPRGPLTVFAVE